MRVIGIICLLGAGLVFLGAEGSASGAAANKAAAAKKGSGKKKAHGVRGVVESVNPGSITVKVHHRKKKGNAANAPTGNMARTFQIGANTQIFHNGKAVGLAGLSPGKRVVLHTVPGQRQQVARIDIVSGKNGKKKA